MTQRFRLPPEWAQQQAVLISWPHAQTDWAKILPFIYPCYTDMARAITQSARLIIVVPNAAEVKSIIADAVDMDLVSIYEMPTNDTWARDFGPISVTDGEHWRLLDYKFNGWGLKFPACFDNLITRNLIAQGAFEGGEYVNRLNFVLEGGSIDIDADGTLLTTEECLLSPNRNGGYTKEQIEQHLIEDLGASKVIWLTRGAIIGDDTDSHIDTLARFLPGGIITYAACDRPDDPNYAELKAMEQELEQATNAAGEPYRLVPLYLPHTHHDFHGEPTPATYANFLLLNGTVLLPTYRDPYYDALAQEAMAQALPGWKIIPIECRYLTFQHGSLHCATMQIPCSQEK